MTTEDEEFEAIAKRQVSYTGNGTAGRENMTAPTGFLFQMPKAEKQEPVGYFKKEGDVWNQYYEDYPNPDELTALYTHPQPNLEWVGLMDEEIALVCAECAASAHNWNDISFARAIEAKLKEKNT